MDLIGKHVYIQLRKGLGSAPIFRVGERQSDLIRAGVVAENDHGLGIALETVRPYNEPEEFSEEGDKPEFRGVAFIPWSNILYAFQIEGSGRGEHRVWKMAAAARN